MALQMLINDYFDLLLEIEMYKFIAMDENINDKLEQIKEEIAETEAKPNLFLGLEYYTRLQNDFLVHKTELDQHTFIGPNLFAKGENLLKQTTHLKNSMKKFLGTPQISEKMIAQIEYYVRSLSLLFIILIEIHGIQIHRK